MKRDVDDTDFRAVRASYGSRDPSCIFCNIERKRVLVENELAYSIRDAYPVTNLHTLIIPKRHKSSYFDLGRPEINACNELLGQMKDQIVSMDSTIKGFNMGINDGMVAGQTINHVHIHMIPRRLGDVTNPRGGIRNVIPGKGNY
jgi:diadenosine tetraphosphate (Ap4A) HIT family hydrolase